MTKLVASFASNFAFILLLLSGNVASRHLYYDDSMLVSGGVIDGVAEESFLRLKGVDSYEEQCSHMYGFLPCSSNLLGHICLLMIYEFLLYHAESFAGGDGRIFRVFGKNPWVSYFSQLLDALPDSLILLVTGLSTSEEKAQDYVVTGAGMLAGSSILLLSFLWGACFTCSRKELYVEPKANENNEVIESKVNATVSYVRSKVIQLLTGSGVLTDMETKYHAKVLFYSLIPFIVVLLPSVFGLSYSSPEYKIVLLVSLVVAVLCVFFYFRYQYYHPRIIQNRRREYAEVEQKIEMNIPFYEVEALILDRDKNFMIMEREMEKKLIGNPEESNEKFTKKKFYDDFKVWIEDTRQLMDNPPSSDKSQMEYNQVLKLLHENKNYFKEQISRMLKRVKRDVTQDGVLEGAQNGEQDIAQDIYSFFQNMDTDKNGSITTDELKNFIMKVNDKKLLVDDGIAEIMMRHLDTDRNGNIDKLEFRTGISKLLKLHNSKNPSKSSNQETHRSAEAKAKKNEEKAKKNEETAKKNERIQAVIWLLVGIGMLCGLAEPLVESVRELSESLRIGPFYLWFILVPWATNIRTVFAAIRAARQKRHQTISVIFSEIYHKVFMNNIVGFIVIVTVIYFRGLTWHFSAELLVVIIVCIIMGLLGSFKTKFPNWTLLVVFPLYPLSLLVVYLVNDAFQFP
uniref:sodium/calcium exchanger NCL2-like n=1 Tax=Erigeron canadensis TaxID=72917 RepID=UPI001CB99B14|nr:sodium/calcium exchanger NCL2-like [Erigeron canadensis]